MSHRWFSAFVLSFGVFALGACGDEPETTETDETDIPEEEEEEEALPPTPVDGTLVNNDEQSFTITGVIEETLTGQATVTEAGLTGSLQWNVDRTLVGASEAATICEASLALTGTPYTGDCDGCDFAFDISATVAAQTGETEDCGYQTYLHYQETAENTDPALIFHDALELDGAPVSNVLMTRYTYVYDDYTYETDSYVASDYTGTYDYYYGLGDATLADNGDDSQTLSWTWSDSRDEYFINPIIDQAYQSYYTYNTCGGDYAYVTQPNWSHEGTRDTLPCAETYPFDLWEVELRAGDTFLTTVDTVASETAFDPALFIMGPDQCYAAQADEDFDCTFAPVAFTCPGASIDVVTDGTYQVLVQSLGSCRGDIGEYVIHFGTAQ